MSDEPRFIRMIQVAALLGMAVVLVLIWGHIAFNWFADGTPAESWYYAATMSLQLFFILVQVWIIRLRRKAR